MPASPRRATPTTRPTLSPGPVPPCVGPPPSQSDSRPPPVLDPDHATEPSSRAAVGRAIVGPAAPRDDARSAPEWPRSRRPATAPPDRGSDVVRRGDSPASSRALPSPRRRRARSRDPDRWSARRRGRDSRRPTRLDRLAAAGSLETPATDPDRTQPRRAVARPDTPRARVRRRLRRWRAPSVRRPSPEGIGPDVPSADDAPGTRRVPGAAPPGRSATGGLCGPFGPRAPPAPRAPSPRSARDRAAPPGDAGAGSGECGRGPERRPGLPDGRHGRASASHPAAPGDAADAQASSAASSASNPLSSSSIPTRSTATSNLRRWWPSLSYSIRPVTSPASRSRFSRR